MVPVVEPLARDALSSDFVMDLKLLWTKVSESNMLNYDYNCLKRLSSSVDTSVLLVPIFEVC